MGAMCLLSMTSHITMLRKIRASCNCSWNQMHRHFDRARTPLGMLLEMLLDSESRKIGPRLSGISGQEIMGMPRPTTTEADCMGKVWRCHQRRNYGKVGMQQRFYRF